MVIEVEICRGKELWKKVLNDIDKKGNRMWR